MPDFAPFAGLRFDPNSVDPAAAISPPYDVIDEAQHQRLLDHDPNNVVRWILGSDPKQPYADLAEYRKRGQLVDDLHSAGTLMLDEEPAFYRYTMRFLDADGQAREYRGLFGAVDAAPWARGGVLPHEEVRAHVVEDRLQLLRATEMNMGVVQLVVDDRSGELARLVEAAPAELLFEGRDFEDQHHRLEAIRDKDSLAAIAANIGPRTSVVADGHHRYTTAVRFREESSLPGADRALALIADLFQEGIVIYPTHRVLVWNDAPSGAAQQLAEALAPLDDGDGAEWRWELPDGTTKTLRSRTDTGVPTLARRLQEVVSSAQVTPEVKTFHDEAAARECLEQAEGEVLAVWMPPVGTEEFWDRTAGEEVFPPKTTYFLPKVCTGVVARTLR